jgi:hypothetical protein
MGSIIRDFSALHFRLYHPIIRDMAEKYISEVTIVLDAKYEDQLKTNEAVGMLKTLGMNVTNVDEDDSVVEGDIDSSKLGELEHLDCVDYVRTVFSYVSDD